MWKPYRGLSGARLGQLPSAIVDEAAKTVIAQADPAIRRIVHEERARIARAGKTFVPYAAVGIGGIIGSIYLAPKGANVAKAAGLISSVALLGLGGYLGLKELEGPPAAAPEPGPNIPFLGDIASQVAQAIVKEAEPRVKVMLADISTDLTEAGTSALPFAAGSAATFFGTAYLVPESTPVGKAAGYTVSAALMLVGIWRALTGLE